uniref:CSON007952 protein n=1 Tax=Culicoides sonorensis TaxID=179676 RepID=A0A336LU01_CULSO
MAENRYKVPQNKGVTIQMLQQQQQNPAQGQKREPLVLNGQLSLPQMFQSHQTQNNMDNIPKTVHALIQESKPTSIHYQPQPKVLQFQTQPMQQQPLQQQHQIQSQQKPIQMEQHSGNGPVSNLWLLVEWEADGENIYYVINASELIGNNSGTIQTGKSVWFKHGSVIIQATIVLISDDKVYIDRELNDLRKMAAQNLADSNKKRLSNGRSGSQKDKTIIPKSIQSKNQETSNSYCPPMTFDQQTQTDNRLNPSNGGNEELSQKINEMMRVQTQTMKLLEKLMSQQQQLFEQTSANNRSVSELSQQLSNIESNLKGNSTSTDVMIPKTVEEQKTEYIYFSNHGHSTDSKMSNANSEGNLVIAEFEQGINGELIKRPASRVSYNETTNMSTFSTDGSEFVLTDSRANSSVITLNTSNNKNMQRKSEIKRRSNNSSTTNVSMIMDDWKEEEDENGQVTIGPNNTKIQGDVYKSIDWSSYKAATRKLLVTLFPREILATHSLTGRPSPAFHDRNRPAKDRLDQNIIGDIVYAVTRHCDVPESLVRTAITTKCADENKMSRQRSNKRKLKDEHDESLSKIPHYDKENSISLSNN